MNSKKLLGNNYDRKDRMKPFTYAFLDFSSTIGSQLKPARGQFDKLMVDDRVPEWNPHIHAIMAIHPHTLDNIEALGSKGLEIFFKDSFPTLRRWTFSGSKYSMNASS